MRKVRIGMISFAHLHAVSYMNALLRRSDVELVAIADENMEQIERHAKPGIDLYRDHQELLKLDIDAVVICSENIKHAPLTAEAAQARKHVMCEKPLATTEEDMLRMIKVCADNGVQLMTAFPCRYIPAVVQAKGLIDKKDIGDILAVKGTNRGTMPGGWFVDKALSGGGAVIDHTVHVMDLLNWIIASPVAEVYAESAKLFHDIPEEDAGLVHVKFENGVQAVIDTSWSRPKSFPTWGDVTMNFIGTEGVLAVDSFAQKNDVYSDKATKAGWSTWGDNMDEAMVGDFITAIKEGRNVPITGEDGLRSTQVALAAYESIRTRKPVRIGG